MDSEFGCDLTDSEIEYIDDGEKIIITSRWDKIPKKTYDSINTSYQDEIDFFYQFPNFLSFCLDIDSINYLNKKLKEIPEDKVRYIINDINFRVYTLLDWYKVISVILESGYSIDGSVLLCDLVRNLNRYLNN